MDKSKIEDLLHQVIGISLGNIEFGSAEKNEAFKEIKDLVVRALTELGKTDWISVDDELPPYEESVLVTSSEDTEEIYFSHRTKRPEVVVDNNGFAMYVGAKITHWQRIKKLEE